MVNTAGVSGQVTRISVAPVKSLGLTHPQSVELGRFGVVGDRRFWLVDADGRLVNGMAHVEVGTARFELATPCSKAARPVLRG